MQDNNTTALKLPKSYLYSIIIGSAYMASTSVFDTSNQALYKVNITERWGKEYAVMMEDISRFVAIQFIIQLLLFTMDGSMFPFFSPDFFLLLLFIIIGVMFYHMVLKKLVVFV